MTKEQAIEQLKDLKAVYSGAVQAGEISIANMIKGGIDLIEKLQEENEELKENYNSLIDKIILKIDEYDYNFEKAKRQNKNDMADYYWDLIGNFKKLLGGE